MIRSRGGDGGGGVIQRTRTSLTASRTGEKEEDGYKSSRFAELGNKMMFFLGIRDEDI